MIRFVCYPLVLNNRKTRGRKRNRSSLHVHHRCRGAAIHRFLSYLEATHDLSVRNVICWIKTSRIGSEKSSPISHIIKGTCASPCIFILIKAVDDQLFQSLAEPSLLVKPPLEILMACENFHAGLSFDYVNAYSL